MAEKRFESKGEHVEKHVTESGGLSSVTLLLRREC